jgi:LCP family protein required for cell wall assembly
MTTGTEHDVFDGPTTRRAPRRRRRWGRVLIVGAVVVALLAVGSVAGYFAFLNWQVNSNLSYSQLLPDEEIMGEDEPVEPVPVDRPATAGEARNFLIIGTDSRDLSVERGRSDVIVLVHVSDERDRVDLIHFPRDYFVDIPGSSRQNKINASYSFGGAPLLVETLQPIIGVPVDEVAIVDFDSFEAMTDAIGGVEVNVAEASPGFPAGPMAMDGETGLAFVRERYTLSQGDISRGQRQQAFIKAVMEKALSRETLTNPARFASFVDAATTNLTVDDDLDMGEMRSLALSMRNVRGDDIHFVTAPWSGIGSDDWAGSIVNPAWDQVDVLAEHLQADTMEDYSDPVSPQSGFGG